MSKILIYDTETTSLEKPFCYNVGYVVYDTDERKVLLTEEYVCEQVWHNPMLFTTAYYADKRPFYVKAMRTRTAKLEKFGYICRRIARIIKDYDIHEAYAYNGSFDEKVFNFNCDWFKCINPFDNVKLLDIRGYFHHIIDSNFINWCDDNEKFTDSGNYSTTAETVYQFISGNDDFEESHTALDDSRIETEILVYCLDKGCELGKNYIAKKSITRNTIKQFVVKKNGEELLNVECSNIMFRKKSNTVLLK